MIHNACPCCQCHYPPHHAECTFSSDCPEECDDFGYAAGLRRENEQLRAEVERLRMTERDHEAMAWAIAVTCTMPDPIGPIQRERLRDLIARHKRTES